MHGGTHTRRQDKKSASHGNISEHVIYHKQKQLLDTKSYGSLHTERFLYFAVFMLRIYYNIGKANMGIHQPELVSLLRNIHAHVVLTSKE